MKTCGFDRFIHEQLAADVIVPKDQPWRLAAMGFLDAGPGVRQQPPRPDRRPHRHGHARASWADRRLRPLPRPQVRRDSHGRLLFALRSFRQQRGPARAPADRSAGQRRRLTPSSRRQAGRKRRELRAVSRQPVQAAFRDGAAADARLSGRGRPPSPPDPLETAIFFLSLAPEDLRPQIVARWRRYLQAASPAGRSGLWSLARPDGAAGVRLRRRRPATVVARWQNPADRERSPAQLNPLVAELLEHAVTPIQGRRRPGLRRIDPHGSTRRLAGRRRRPRRTPEQPRAARSRRSWPTATARRIFPRARPITTCRAARRTGSAAS